MGMFAGARNARALVAWVVLALVATGVAGCGGDQPSAEGGGDDNAVVRIGVLPTSGIAPLHLGVKKGFFAEHGIKIETQIAAGGAAIVPAVVSGDLDVGYGASVSSAIARAKGLPIKIVSQGIIGAKNADNSINKVVVRGSGDIKSPKDLEGKTVAVNTLGSVAEILIKAVLEKSDVDISNVEFIEIPLPEMLQALEDGQADAVWATEPFLSQAEAEGQRALFSMDAEFAPNASLASYFTSEKFISENTDVVSRLAEAVDESLAYAQEHPDEVRDVIGTYLDIPEEAIKSMTLPVWGPEMHADTIRMQMRHAAKYGLIEQQPDMNELIYDRAG